MFYGALANLGNAWKQQFFNFSNQMLLIILIQMFLCTFFGNINELSRINHRKHKIACQILLSTNEVKICYMNLLGIMKIINCNDYLDVVTIVS